MELTFRRFMGYVSLSFALLVFLSACTSLGLQAPRGTQQQIAYSYGIVAGLRESAAQGLQQGSVNVTEAKKVLELTDQARALLDTAQLAAVAGDTVGSQQNLLQAQSLVTQVQGMLQVYIRTHAPNSEKAGRQPASAGTFASGGKHPY